MSRRTFSGREVAKVLDKMGYEATGGRGSHRKFSYKNEDTGEVRHVLVPLHDELAPGTLREIADQCGAEDFDAWCEWIDNHS